MQIIVANMKGGSGKSTLVASMATVLNADIVDHDHQGTLRMTAALTGLFTPVEPGAATKQIVIHDTPPYNSSELRGYLKMADLVLIPCKVKYPDLLAVRAIADQLADLKMSSKGTIVFNEVRKPYTRTHRELKDLFTNNYPELKFAKSELSNLVSFTRVFSEGLKGQAREEVEKLCLELGII